MQPVDKNGRCRKQPPGQGRKLRLQGIVPRVAEVDPADVPDTVLPEVVPLPSV